MGVKTCGAKGVGTGLVVADIEDEAVLLFEKRDRVNGRGL